MMVSAMGFKLGNKMTFFYPKISKPNEFKTYLKLKQKVPSSTRVFRTSQSSRWMFQDSLWGLQDNRSKENLARWLTMPKPASRTWHFKPFSHWMRLWSSFNQLSPDPSTKSTKMVASVSTLFILTTTLLSRVMDNKSLVCKKEGIMPWCILKN